MDTSTPRTVQQLSDLSGRTALITGGSRGLGLQMAHALGEAGATIVLASRKAADLEAATATLADAGIQAHWIAVDASTDAGRAQLVDEALAYAEHIDILVNNAGATWGAPAEDYPADAWDKVMNLNVRSLFLLSQAIATRCMIPRRAGRIINIASVAALGGNPDLMQAVGYNTSKGAVVTLTRALATEWGRYGITVNAIGPGVFPSKMSKAMIAQHGGADGIARHNPLRRVGGDEDLKGAALLFASDAGQYITGQLLLVDGGASAMING